MKVAFIHNEKKLGTGAHFINDLMAGKLKEVGVEVKNFYPQTSAMDTPLHLNGLKSILFFYSLLERRKEILRYNIIQGTTYTVLPFLVYQVPVVCHFGSTTRGFLHATPLASKIERSTRTTYYRFKKEGALSELNMKTRRPLRDIAEIEEYVASRATAVIATSNLVVKELIASGVQKDKIHLIHNAIEDYWFETPLEQTPGEAGIVFLGRLGNANPFTTKLKGMDRLIHLYEQFPHVKKYSFCLIKNGAFTSWFRTAVPNHSLTLNHVKDQLPKALQRLRGSILFISSRYEGFSLSLIEGMSQGLIPISYRVGVAPEIIHDGENGFLVSNQAEAIERAGQILKNKELREKMSAGAMATSRQFSSGVIAKRLVKLYETILAPFPTLAKEMVQPKSSI